MTRKKSEPAPGYPSQFSQYDKIWRENLIATLPGIIEKVLKIQVAHSEALPGKIQVTEQKEVDHFEKVTDVDGSTFILHIEAQAEDDPTMVYRMLGYRTMAEQVYGLPVRQYVIYLGKKRSRMQVSIDSPGLKYEYMLISLREIPYQVFLSSKIPEEKLLAVLGDFGKEDATAVLKEVISGIRAAPGGDLAENQLLKQLRVIIQLRNLAIEFNKVMETVAKFFKEEKDPFFIKGKMEGKLEGQMEGRLEGRLEGELEGKLKGKVEVIRNLLRSGRFSTAEIAHFTSAEEAFIQEVAAQMKEE